MFSTPNTQISIFEPHLFCHLQILSIWISLNICHLVKSLPNEKFLEVTKLKAFADKKLSVAKIKIFLFDRAENPLEKGDNAGYQYFLLFPLCFPKPSSFGTIKVGIVW